MIPRRGNSFRIRSTVTIAFKQAKPSLDNKGVYLGIMEFSKVFLPQIADTKSLLDMTNSLGIMPAESHNPESGLIDDIEFLYLALCSLLPD